MKISYKNIEIPSKIFVKECDETIDISNIFSQFPNFYIGDHRYILCDKDKEYLKKILETEIRYLFERQKEKGII